MSSIPKKNRGCTAAAPVIGITMGDSNGIGPEILVRALARPSIRRICRMVVLGDRAVLEKVGREIGVGTDFFDVDSMTGDHRHPGAIPVLSSGCTAPSRRPGVLDPRAGHCAAEWIKSAARLALQGRLQGIVTCPVNKDGMLQGGCPYAGHTPMLAALTKTKECYMSLFSKHMRIVHITAHLSMSKAVAAVKRNRILNTIRISHETLGRMGFESPRIAVAGINPHAGENGAFGREETDQIIPAVEQACREGMRCTGPYSPDTVFSRMRDGEFDLVVAMYHDQGHIPFKLVAMDEGVHVTLGLPFVRTSPDHGTAFDIAGKGRAREASLCAAIRLAAQWAKGAESAPGVRR